MMEPVHMGPSMSLGMILLFILIYNRKHMRVMDLAAVLRYAVIVTLLGIDQPEATVSTVLFANHVCHPFLYEAPL